jgi:arabinose-5-phosphate isomerase
VLRTALQSKGREIRLASNLPLRNRRDAALTGAQAIASARRTIETERTGLSALHQAFDNGLAEPFAEAVAVIRAARGRVVVSGVGKSGHIGRKIAATLASTGTPSFFMHAAEASHGDLGMVTSADVAIIISWSGETVELKSIVEYAKRFAIPIIAITARPESSLARQSTVALTLPAADEACPHGLAPTTSTLMQMALGDALAIALLESRGFTAEKFRDFHPGGRLGASLRLISEIMHRGAAVPLAVLGTPMSEAIVAMSEKGFGCLGITDGDGCLVGIITDGDLRRHMGPRLLDMTTAEIMTRHPKSIAPDALAATALELCNASSITALFVVAQGKPVGIVHIHDLLRLGVA